MSRVRSGQSVQHGVTTSVQNTVLLETQGPCGRVRKYPTMQQHPRQNLHWRAWSCTGQANVQVVRLLCLHPWSSSLVLHSQACSLHTWDNVSTRVRMKNARRDGKTTRMETKTARDGTRATFRPEPLHSVSRGSLPPLAYHPHRRLGTGHARADAVSLPVRV